MAPTDQINPNNPQPAMQQQQPPQNPRSGMFEQFIGNLMDALKQGFDSGRGPGI